MKTKLQALIAEQKALTAKFEELLYSTTEKSSTLDPKKVYIKGHPTRGAEVIKMLEDLGGVNRLKLEGRYPTSNYYLDPNYTILALNQKNNDFSDYTELHLPEAVSEENTQITDIKVGNWIWIDDIVGYDEDGVGHRVVNNNPHYVVQVEPDGIFVVFEGKHLLIDSSDKFHKVKPPKEKVELLDVEEWSKTHKNYPIICRNSDDSSWSVKLMCEYVKGKALVRTKSTQKQWMSQAIPYNDQTKQLVGTTNTPDKHYKFVEK